MTVHVTVMDVNDNPPALDEQHFRATVPEDAAINTVLAKIRSSDPDEGVNRLVSYRLLDDAGGHFIMDELEGLVSLARPLDREVQNTYTAVLEARDGGTPALTSTGTLTITVADINDNPPEFVRTMVQVTVPEDTPVGTEVTRVIATSRDIGVNAEIAYALQPGASTHYLHIHPHSGVVTVLSPLDYETVQSVVVTVVATDGGSPPLSATSLLNVTVNDINDNEPIFAQESYTGRVSEGAPLGEYIAQLSAHDADSGDNGRLEYSLTRGDLMHHFAVHYRTGALTLARGVDREQFSHYSLTVTVTDHGTPSLSATVSVLVTVGDINDNPPRFDRHNYTAIVQEDKKLGYPVLRLHVTDADDASNGAPFTWEVLDVSGSPSFVPLVSTFALDQDGVIRLASTALDHKVHREYLLRIRVYDSGSPPMFSDCSVNITVVERSRYPPTVFPLHVTVFSYRTAYRGGIIGKVSALDKDPYDTLDYSISSYVGSTYSTADVEYFDVDNEDGTLVAVMPLDAGIYHVNISVSDGKFTHSVDVSINVHVLTQQMVDNAVILNLGPISPEKFVASYKEVLIQSIAGELYFSDRQINIISVQSSIEHGGRTRIERDLTENLDILLVIKKNEKEYYSRGETLNLLTKSASRIKRRVALDKFNVMKSICSETAECTGNGECVDLIGIKDDIMMPLNTRVGSVVALRFEHKSGCHCHQGFGGELCQELINACGHKPCSSFQVCTPTDLIPKGFLCHCKVGFAGEQCDIDVSKCHNLSCYYPIRPLSFRGKSYAQYAAPHQSDSSSLQLSMYVRTRHPVGVLSFASGSVDYSVLEISDGYVQYRWDCGSGEGVVRTANKKINDNKWHFINITRKGTMSVLSLDGIENSSAAPGDSDVLNVESDYMYLGAKVTQSSLNPSVEYGFVGCIDEVTFDGNKLPLSLSTVNGNKASLKRFVNVELTCPESLPVAGICGSHPCGNGGTCTELNEFAYECSCSDRYSGKQCEFDEAPCSSSPCLNDGACVVKGNSYKCNCPIKLSGKRCEYGVYCNPNPCQNGGRCEEGSNGPICKCHHYAGERCQRDIDECTQNPCRNGGTCLNFYGGFRCLCPYNVSGEYCTDAITTSASSLSISLEDLFVILAVFIFFALLVLGIIVWQKRRCKQKKQQQNNRVKLTAHVKNDLKGVDHRPHRNSKLCNVEADQRPRSFVSGGDESLKQWAEAAPLEAMELDLLSRHTTDRDGGDMLSRHLASDPNLNKSPSGGIVPKLVANNSNVYLGDQHVDLRHKPWDHHNNLNDSYFTPVKGEVYVDTSIADSAVNRNNFLLDDNGGRPTTPLITFRSGGDCTPLGHVASPATDVLLSPGVAMSPMGSSVVAMNNPQYTRHHELHPDHNTEDCYEERPLLSYTSQKLPEVVLCSRDTSSDVPLLSGNQAMSSSFDDLLLANNMSLDSSDDAINETPVASSAVQPNMKYNITVSEDGDGEKISNVPPNTAQTLAKTFVIPKIRNDRQSRTEPRKKCTPKDTAAGNGARLGNPRSRRPIVRGDYGRVSDLSFISNTDSEQDQNGLESDFHDDSEDEQNELSALHIQGPNTTPLTNI